MYEKLKAFDKQAKTNPSPETDYTPVFQSVSRTQSVLHPRAPRLLTTDNSKLQVEELKGAQISLEPPVTDRVTSIESITVSQVLEVP